GRQEAVIRPDVGAAKELLEQWRVPECLRQLLLSRLGDEDKIAGEYTQRQHPPADGRALPPERLHANATCPDAATCLAELLLGRLPARGDRPLSAPGQIRQR